jgi:hypothetical protein
MRNQTRGGGAHVVYRESTHAEGTAGAGGGRAAVGREGGLDRDVALGSVCGGGTAVAVVLARHCDSVEVAAVTAVWAYRAEVAGVCAFGVVEVVMRAELLLP